MIGRILIFMFITSCCCAQTPNNTLVFKVRAPATECTILCDGGFFWLEIDNPVQIKIKGAKNIKTRVKVENGKIISVKDDINYIRFTKTGNTVISVYQITPRGSVLIATKKMEIKNPVIYFCDIKLDSISKYIRLEGSSMYAYSRYYKKNMEITSFDMYFIEDTTKKSRSKAPPVCMQSEANQISAQMKKMIRNFQPKYNSIYMQNIICKTPDGSKRLLDPIELGVDVDTTNKEKLSLIYSIRRKVL
jgi:hypothetical protein